MFYYWFIWIKMFILAKACKATGRQPTDSSSTARMPFCPHRFAAA